MPAPEHSARRESDPQRPRGSERDQGLPDLDQDYSGADQTASDADQDASDADEAASASNQEDADIEERASDRDQAAADEERALGPASRSSQRTYQASRAERVEATAARVAAASSRATTEQTRARQARLRDETARLRDETADSRALELAISECVARLYLDKFGKGPLHAETFIAGDVVTAVLGDVYTAPERMLLANGRGENVLITRTVCRQATDAAFKTAVECLTGRRVLSAVGGFGVEDDVAVEVFLLAPEPAS